MRTEQYTGVILAAGRGSRMKHLTADRPKCLLPLAGKPLLHWQLAALRRAGVQNILVVRGYKAEMLRGEFSTVDNPRWAETNMVRSLLCALPHLHGTTACVSYSDIVYRMEHVALLCAAAGDICLTYDTDWEKLWRLRQGNPLEDAETFRGENGRLLEIGGKPSSLEDVRGQYMGLLKLTPAGQSIIREYVFSLPPEVGDHLDMTGLLRGLLARGREIRICAVSGGWCECDTEEDITNYEQALSRPGWPHDWR